ncbi:hypothetical protein [Variovorax gossypii]
MLHSFVYRGVRIDVVIKEQDDCCRWTCKTNGVVKKRWFSSRAVSMGEGLRLACIEARQEVDLRKGGAVDGHV